MRARLLLIVLPPLLLLSAALGFVAAEARAKPRQAGLFWSDDVMRQMRSLVEETYVDEVSPDQSRALFYSACKAYLSGLDPYCEFYTPEERRAMEQETQGEFGGVGILGTSTKDGVRVRGARREDPAWKAGIRAGDLLVAIDGADATGEAGREVLQRLRGEPGTAVRVAWVPAAGGARREATVSRSRIKIDSVLGAGMLDAKAGIGYLRIVRFQENTAGDLKAALRRLRQDGARSYVVDLRSDYGGVLPAAVACADCFLSSGAVVVTHSRSGSDAGRAAGPDAEDVLDEPLVLLVDGATASAAEVLAGALQDHRRAVLVGERTYGKFLVQRIVPLEGEDVAVRLTTARYYTPFGRNLQRDDSRGVRGGIVPEVPVAPTEDQKEPVRRWFEDQVGLDWDVLPGVPAPADPILDKAVRILRDAAAIESAAGK